MKKFLIVLMGLMVIGLCGCANGNEKDDGKKAFSTGSVSYEAYLMHTTGLTMDDGDVMEATLKKTDLQYFMLDFPNATSKRYSLNDLENYLKSIGFIDVKAAEYAEKLFEVEDSVKGHFILMRNKDTLYMILNEE